MAEEEIYGTSMDKNNELCIGSHIFCLTKIAILHNVFIYYQPFGGKLEAAFQLFCGTAVLKISEDFQKSIGGGWDLILVNFFSLQLSVKTNVLGIIIFYNSQTNKYMASPISIL